MASHPWLGGRNWLIYACHSRAHDRRFHISRALRSAAFRCAPFRSASPQPPVLCLPAYRVTFAGPLCFVIRVRTGFIRKLMIAAVTLMIAAIWASSCHAAISAGVSHISGLTVSYSPGNERLHVPHPIAAGAKGAARERDITQVPRLRVPPFRFATGTQLRKHDELHVAPPQAAGNKERPGRATFRKHDED